MLDLLGLVNFIKDNFKTSATWEYVIYHCSFSRNGGIIDLLQEIIWNDTFKQSSTLRNGNDNGSGGLDNNFVMR